MNPVRVWPHASTYAEVLARDVQVSGRCHRRLVLDHAFGTLLGPTDMRVPA